MDYMKNKCPVCNKHFCCSAHRADHEVKNHSEMYPKLKQDFLVQLFKKRTQKILLNSQNRQACGINEKGHDNLPKISIPNNTKLPVKRVYSEVNRHILSKSVSVSETRKILVPVHRLNDNQASDNKTFLKTNCNSLTSQDQQNTYPHDCNEVKTSTPIFENLSEEKTPTSNWNYISPASSISYYGTPHIFVDGKSDGRPLFRPQSNKTSITPLRSIMAKNSKLVLDNDAAQSPYFNSSKGRRVTFSFSSSRVSGSSNSSPLESVKEIEIFEEIQDENKDMVNSLSSVRNLCETEILTGTQEENNYVFKMTSTINSCVQASQFDEENMKNMQRFTEDSLASVKGGLFSCVTNMFCTAVQTFPLWRGYHGGNRSKRSRSPDTGVVDTVVTSPLQKRPCYPQDLRLNPIRSRKPMRADQTSQPYY